MQSRLRHVYKAKQVRKTVKQTQTTKHLVPILENVLSEKLADILSLTCEHKLFIIYICATKTKHGIICIPYIYICIYIYIRHLKNVCRTRIYIYMNIYINEYVCRYIMYQKLQPMQPPVSPPPEPQEKLELEPRPQQGQPSWQSAVANTYIWKGLVWLASAGDGAGGWRESFSNSCCGGCWRYTLTGGIPAKKVVPLNSLLYRVLGSNCLSLGSTFTKTSNGWI